MRFRRCRRSECRSVVRARPVERRLGGGLRSATKGGDDNDEQLPALVRPRPSSIARTGVTMTRLRASELGPFRCIAEWASL
jgi:hypothetical protein